MRRKKLGITLVELMIAMGLATLVAGAVVGIMATGSRMWKGGVSKLKVVDQQSALLSRISKELEEASKIYWADGTGIAFYRQGYTVEGTSTPHGCTGANISHPNCSNPNAVPWDSKYAGGPYWRGLESDIVWFYTKTVGGKTVIVRKVTDGFTPTIVRSPETIISDPDIDIAKLRFTYWNFMGYFFDDRIRRFSPVPPGATDITPDTRIVQAKISPSDYPQNIWKTMEWTRNIPGGTQYTQYARVVPEANISVWWDDTTVSCITGSCGTTSLPGVNPWSGESAVRVGPALGTNPNLGIKTAQVSTGGPAPPTSNDLLYFNDSVPASFNLSKQPTADPDTPNGCQLDITLGSKKKSIGGTIEESECTGYVTISGLDPGNNSISTTLEFFGCGFTLTTPNIFKTVNTVTTVGLADEKFSDDTSSAPSITIINPNKKVWLLAHIYIDPYPLDYVRILAFHFNVGGNWRTAYWAHINDKNADNNSNGTPDINEITSNLSSDGRDRMYMGPLPPSGGWAVLGVPLAYPGTRLEGVTIPANGMRVSVVNGRAYIDKVVYVTWSNWQEFTTPSGSSLSPLGEANYIQFKGEFATSLPTTSPTLSDVTIKHGRLGGLSWTRTSDDEWMQGTFSNTVPSYGDVALWRTSGPDNLTQGEVGPFNINLLGYSYYGVAAPGYSAGSTSGIWQRIRWTRSGEVGWAVDFSTWNYRRRITLQDTKGLVRFRDVVVVDIPEQNIRADGGDIRITTLNGTEKPFRYVGKFGTNHRVMFLGNCPGMGTSTYFVYYGNSSATLPTYSKSSTPAWPAGTGIVGNYFNYNVRYRGGDYYPFFPTSTVNTNATVAGPNPGSYQGSFVSQRRDNTINFNWGSGSPASGTTSDYFSVGWRGWMFVDTNTTWQFRITRDDDASNSSAAGYNTRLWINNTLVASTTSANDNTPQTGSIALGIGLHQIMVNYSEYSGGSNILVERSKGTWEVIPTQDLYPNWGGDAWNASYWQFVDPTANNGYGNVNATCGPEQVRGNIDYPDKITIVTRTSEDGTTWSGWQPAPPYGDTSSYPNDGGATTNDHLISNTEGTRRFLQFRATLSTTDTTVTPILAEVKVYNVALDPDGDPSTGPEGWITQTSQDDWEAGLVGTYTDSGMPANLQKVPDTNVRKYPGAVTLASEVGNLINATEERTAYVNVKKDTTHSHIWDQVYWLLGTADWPQPRYKYRRRITISEPDGVPRVREPVIITINEPNIQNGGAGQSPAGGDIRIVNGMGSYVPYRLLRASPPNFTIMFLATLPPKGSLSYWLYYYRVDLAGNREQDPGETYTKTSPVKWADGTGIVGNYFSGPVFPGDSSTTIRNKQFFGTLGGQRRDSTINFIWGTGSPGPVPSDYFSVAWRGYVYLNPSLAGNWQFKIRREENDLGLLPPSAPVDSKQWGYMSLGFGEEYLSTAPDGTYSSRNWSGIDLNSNGGSWTDRYLYATQRVEQVNTTTDESTWTLTTGERGMRLLHVNYAEYARNARAQLYWTPPGQAEQIVPSTELYGFYSRVKAGSSTGARPISLVSIGAQEERQYQPIPGAYVGLQTRISEDGVFDSTYQTYATTVDAQGFGVQDIPQAAGNKRFIQVRANLSTSDITRTPILAEVGLFNRATGSYYVMTEQAHFESYDTLDNIDSTSSPGNLMLSPGTGPNVAIEESIFNPDYSKSTYAANIWTKIKWIRASARWPYPEYLYRRRITFTETAGIMRVNEPVVFEINDSNIQADGKDIRITDTNGSKRPYQLLKNTNPFHIFMLVNCAPNSSVSYYLYYYRLNQAGEITSGRATDTGETYNKTTSSVKWPSGTGLVGSYYTNDINRVAGTVQYQTYRGQWKSPTINFNWGGGGPVASDYFSVTWNGFVYASGTGTNTPANTYKFRLAYNQGARFKIGNPSPYSHNTDPTNTLINTFASNSDDSGTDTTHSGITLSQGFYKVRLEYDEYSGSASVNLYGITTGGNSKADPQDVIIPATELYGYHGNGAEFANNGYQYISGPLSSGRNAPTIGAVETQGADWNLDGNIAVYTQGSHTGATWTPASPGAGPWAGGTGAETSITGGNDAYRYIRFRADLSTSDTTKTPVLAEVSIWNQPAGKWFTVTEQDEWKASDTLSNVDTDALPGSVTLPSGTGGNVSVGTDTNNLSLSVNTYAANIWDTITWWIGYNRWIGGNRLYRRLLTIKEPNIRDREYEPIDISGNFGANKILKADCGDLLLTTEVGTEVAYQMVSCNAGAGTFTIRLPIMVSKNETVKYYLYYGDASATTPSYSKTSSIKFPHGDGIIRRRWGSNPSTNWSGIGFLYYWGRDQRPYVLQGDDDDYFSGRFDGWVYSAGTNTLTVWSDDHQRVWVRGTDYGLKTWAGTQTYTNALAAGFNRITIDFADYSGGAGVTASGVDANGNASGGQIPNDALYVCWTQNTSTAGTPHETPEFNEGVGGVKTWGAEENKRDFVEDPQGRLQMDARGSHDGTNWTAWNTIANYQPARGSGQTDPPTALSLPAGVKGYRFLQWQVTLDTAGNTSYSPILSQVYVRNIPENRIYVTTEMSDFANNSGNSNVDWTRRPGDLMLQEGTTSNTCTQTEVLSQTVSEDTYLANIWTQIRWAVGYDDWPGGDRLYRKLITITEPNITTRINEIIDVTVSADNAAYVCDNGNDIALFTEAGVEIAYQLVTAPGTGTNFTIRFPVTVTQNSSTKFYVYFGNSACNYPAPYPPNSFSKTTSPRFPDGDGLLRRRWTNPDGYNSGSIDKSYYQGRNYVSYVYTDDPWDYFSCRFDGWLYATGNHNLRVISDNHHQVWRGGVDYGLQTYGNGEGWQSYGLINGFNRITIDHGDYTDGASIEIRGVNPQGNSQDVVIPREAWYPAWTENTSSAGTPNEASTLRQGYGSVVQIGAREDRAPVPVTYGRILLRGYWSNDGSSWTGPVNIQDMQPPFSQLTPIAMPASLQTARFLRINAYLDTAGNTSYSPILGNWWVYHSGLGRWQGADSQAGWQGTLSVPDPEAGPIIISTNIDSTSRPGDILLQSASPTRVDASTIGPISVNISKTATASPVWNYIWWRDADFKEVNIRTSATKSGLGSVGWSTDINDTDAKTESSISGGQRNIQYRLRIPPNDLYNASAITSDVRIRDAEGVTTTDNNFAAGTMTNRMELVQGQLTVVRWNATSDATGSGQSTDLSGHLYRRRYTFGTINETREPVEFTVNADTSTYTTNSFTVCRYDPSNDTMVIVAHRLKRQSGNAYRLQIILTGNNQIFYVYYGGTRTTPNYTKTHWNNSYGGGTGLYGAHAHNTEGWFNISTGRVPGDNLRANALNYSQNQCFVCGSGGEYFQDAWRGWIYTSTTTADNTTLYVDNIQTNAGGFILQPGGTWPNGDWSGEFSTGGIGVVANQWYFIEVRHRGYSGGADSVRLRGNNSTPMPLDNLYAARHFDYGGWHDDDTTMPSPTEGPQQQRDLESVFTSRALPITPVHTQDYYIHPSWYGYPVSSDIQLNFNQLNLEDTDEDNDSIQVIRVSDGVVLWSRTAPFTSSGISTGWLGDIGGADVNFILVRYRFSRTGTANQGFSINQMTIRPTSATGGTTGTDRPHRTRDIDTGTIWAGGTPTQRVIFDTGATRRVFRYRFSPLNTANWYRYRFEVSLDASNWVQVSNVTREAWSTPPTSSWYEEDFPVRSARYGRLTILGSQAGDSSIREIELYQANYQTTGEHDKRISHPTSSRSQYLTAKGRRVRLYFSTWNLRAGDEVRLYNDSTGVQLGGPWTSSSPPCSPTPCWSGWFNWGDGNPSTNRIGIPLRFTTTFYHHPVSPSGWSITQYEVDKLAYEEDRSTIHITTDAPWRAIDGDVNTYWDGQNNGAGNGLIIDLGKMKNLFKYEWVCENQAVYRYKVEVSVDRTNWIKVSDYYDANGQDPESGGWATQCSGASPNCTYSDTFPQTDARYVRLTLLSGGNRVRELRIFPTTYKTSGYLIKQHPTERIVDERIVQLPARNVRLYFSSFNLRGNVAGTRDELEIIDNDTGTVLLTLNSSNNASLSPGWTSWLNPSPRKHTSSGFTLRLKLSYMYSAESPSGYTLSSYEYEKLAYDKNLTTGAEDIHVSGREPWYAIDGDDTTTYWQTTGSNNVALVVDFGKLTKLNRVSWKGVAATNYRYKIETSTDGSEWDLKSPEYRYLTNQSSSDGWFADSFADTEARMARIVFVDTGVNATVYEFRCHQTVFSTPGHVISNRFPLPAKAWEFNIEGSLQNWGSFNQLTGVSVSGGIFRAQSTGTDPYMVSPDDLGIIGDDAPFILIRLNASAGTTGQVFFITTDDTVWNETKSRTFTLTTGSWKQYFIDMSDVPGWSGKIIKQIRVDPTNASTGANGIQIDYIRVLTAQKDTKTYYIGARDARLHFSKLYLRGYDRLKIYNDRTGQLLRVYTNNIDLHAEHTEAGYNYPGGGYLSVTPSTSENMVDGSPTPGTDPTVTCTGNGFCTPWFSSITGSGCPVEDGYGMILRVELLYDYQAENSSWDGYAMDAYRTKLLIWDNDNKDISQWQEGSPPVNYVGGNRPSNAVDNSTATYWDGGAPTQKLIIDLGKTESINKINTEYYNSSGIWWRYEIQISLDGADWKRVSSDLRLHQTITQPAGGYVDSFLAQEARYIMLVTTERSSAGNVQVAEIRVHRAIFANPGYAISYKLPSLKTGQQLQNYGFEINTGTTTPTYWTKTGTGTVEHISDVRPNNSSSKQAIRLTDAVTLTSDAISVSPTDHINAQFYEYYLSGWIKTSGNNTATLAIRWQTSGGADIQTDNVTLNTSATGTWEYFEGIWMAPSNAGQARVVISNPDAGSSAIFDDLRFSLADFQYDIKTIRAAAGQIKPHFSRFDMEDTSSTIAGAERMRDVLWMYNDSTGAIIDVDTGTPGAQLRTAADGGILPNPLTSAHDSSDMWLSYLGTADVRIVLRYNYTGLSNKGYTIDQYRYRPRAYACHTDGTNIPDKAIDNIANDNAQFWSPGTNTEDHWIEVDLGRVSSLRRISVVNRYSPSATYYYKVELSADGETWTNIQNLSPSPSTPNPWTTGVVSGTYGSGGFAQTFTRFDAQYVRVTYKAGTEIPRTLEIRIWQTPYITPGSLTSEILPPKRRYDPPAIVTRTLTKGASNGFDSFPPADTPVHRVLKVWQGNILYREFIDYIPTPTGLDWSPTDGAMEPATTSNYSVQYEYGGISSDGAILAGTWNTTANVDTDWSFNNSGWAGGWVDANTGSVYQTVNSDGTLNAGAQNASLNAGAWDGILHLYTPGNQFIHSVNKTGSGGLFDAGIPSLSTDYTVARYLQANFQISNSFTTKTAAWAFMTQDGYGGSWTWKYSNAKSVTADTFVSLTWDMLDGTSSGINWPWINVLPTEAITNSTVLIPANTTGRQPPPDITVPTPRPANEFERLFVDRTPTLRIDISGASVLGSVKITGVDAWGISIDETVKFRENGTMNTRRKFARVDTVQTSGFTGGNITVRCLSFSGTIGRLAFRPHNGGSGYVFIDSLRALPKVSHQKPYIILEGVTIPSGAANPNNSANPVNWNGAGWVSIRFSKFNLYADDILQIWGKSSALGGYDRLLRSFDKNSFPATGGWTGNLGWGYDDFKIVLYHTPTGDSTNCNPAVIIDQFVRSLNFYSSTVKNNSKPDYGAWRAADEDTSTFWKAYYPFSTYKLPSWPSSLNDYQGWYVDLNNIRSVNRAVVKWKYDVVSPGDFIIMGSSDCTNFIPANVVAQGGNTYIFAAMQAKCIGVMHPIDGATSSRQDVEIELAEFEVYPAGDYVTYGNYYSQPYAAPAHMQWIIPYPRDAYDMRIHFTRFKTQPGSSASTSDILRMYNDMQGYRQPGWALMSENTLIGTIYGNTTPPTVTNLPTGQALLKINDCNAPTDPLDPNMRLNYNPLQCDTTAYPDAPTGGYRTPWLLSGEDARWPSSFDKRNIGMRWKLLFTAPLGYKNNAGWEIDRYELYSVINPTLIQIDILAKHGRGRDQKISSQSTKIQPPNLVFR